MISTAEALGHCLALAEPLDVETVPLEQAGGRVLRAPFAASTDQPPFATSVMDGYALADARPGATYRVVGEAAAGHGWDGILAPGEALRIFTGAPVPRAATQVVIQEDVTRDGDTITLGDGLDASLYIRPAGTDFKSGDKIDASVRLHPALVTLAAAMGHAQLQVARRPKVAIMATGDELVLPGAPLGPNQIRASNNFGLKAMAEAAGAEARLLPIARDTRDSLMASFAEAKGADLIVTIGGASVGDHDLVGEVAAELGMARSFYKIAMRPGKPLMAGRLGPAAMLGLPGNPVSSMVCGQLFMVPMIEAMLGLTPGAPPRLQARLAVPLAANGPREHYMRAVVEGGDITPVDNQDSALITRLAQANALLIRPVRDPKRQVGEMVDYLSLLA